MSEPNVRTDFPASVTAPVLNTARLLLRPPRPSDAAPFFAFLGDPAAMRFTHCHASVRECRRRLAAFEWQRRQAGFAPWAVLTRDDGQLVGWGGLYEDPFDPGWGMELGYSLHPAAWGQGYATELARACLAWGDEELEAPEVWAFVHPDNTASRRVLDRTGFTKVRLLPEKERILLRRAKGG